MAIHYSQSAAQIKTLLLSFEQQPIEIKRQKRNKKLATCIW